MDEKKKRLVILVFLCVSILALLSIFFIEDTSKTNKTIVTHSLSTNTSQREISYRDYKLQDSASKKRSRWLVLMEADEPSITNWSPNSIKIMFTVLVGKKKHYLVSQKRVSKKKNYRKDDKWEFPGGRVDTGESPIKALLRELSEEDQSLILYKSLRKSIRKKKDIYFQNIRLASGEKITILKTHLSLNKWLKIKKYYRKHHIYNKETYGFIIIKDKYVDFYKSSMKDQWTPKSVKILKRLRQPV